MTWLIDMLRLTQRKKVRYDLRIIGNRKINRRQEEKQKRERRPQQKRKGKERVKHGKK